LYKVVVGAAGFMAGHAAKAAVDRLTLEAGTGVPDFGDDVASSKLDGAGALVELVDGVEDGGPAARAGVGELACRGGTAMAGPSMVWRFALCKAKPTSPLNCGFAPIARCHMHGARTADNSQTPSF
jgi:hypothetical protein